MEAAAAQDVGRVADPLEEVGDEARLPDPGWSEEREETTRPVRDGILVVTPEPLTLALASDERRLRGDARAARHGDDLDQPVRLDGLRLPLEREWLDRLDPHCVANEQPRRVADEHLAAVQPPARGGRRR